MKLRWEYLVAAAAFVVTLLLAWFVGMFVHMQGTNLTILRVGIVVLGVLCILGFLIWARGDAPTPAGLPAVPAVPSMPSAPSISLSSGAVPVIVSDVSPDDIDRLVHEAEKKVSSSRLGKGAKLSGLPAIFVLGDTGSGKTSAILNSGLDPELLAGQIYQDGNVTPTAAANVWFARKSVFVEAAGKIAGDPKPWARLLHRLSPGGLRAIFGKNTQAPRAAIVCFDCEKLVKSAGPDALVSMARTIRARLEEMSHQLGSSFPVYVIFSKLDQVAYAAEFLGSLRDEEVTHVLGITLPVTATAGVYAEQETKRLSASFNSLFATLADCRPGLLSRERDKTKQASIYEFARQFRRLGKPAVEFLVELCRPSHLRSGPFLRGFYFSGRRMVASTTPSPAALAQTMVRQAPESGGNATMIMRAEDLPQMGQMGQTAVGSGTTFGSFGTGTMISGAGSSEPVMVPQWAFLSHVFSHVILQDRAALGASGASSKVSSWRRLLYASAAGAAAILFVMFLISFLANHSMESQVVDASQAIHASAAPSGDVGSLTDWQALDNLRKPLQVLSDQQINGVPLYMRWGLYNGDDLYTQGRAVYFARFRQLFFNQTYSALQSGMMQLPTVPGANDDYSGAYNRLKAYLIVSSYHDKATRDFLTPTLMKYWPGAVALDEDRRPLVQQQLDFYADELKISNPYSLDPDANTVGKTRAYLAQFAASQRVYHAMIADASKNNPAFNFNRKYPDAVAVVHDGYDVQGAFTKAGWTSMQNAMQHPGQYGGEDWVVGGFSQGSSASGGNSQTDLKSLYTKDYIQTWRDFVSQAAVTPGGSYQDRAQKLGSLSGNRSPLLMLLCEVSQNTAVDSQDVTKAFAAPQAVVVSPCQDQVIQDGNRPYVGQLAAAQACLMAIPPPAPGTPGDPLTAAVNQCLAPAHAAADQLAQKFPIDNDGKMDVRVKALLDQPTGAGGLVAQAGGPGLQGVAEVCSALKPMEAKYPFNAAASSDVSLADFIKFFQPGTGDLAGFLAKNKDSLVVNGTQYSLKSGKPDALLAFVNRAADIQRALFPAGATSPQFKFTVTAHPQAEIINELLTIEGQSLAVRGNQQGDKAFVWTGSGAKSSLEINGGSYGEYSGAWGAFRLLGVYTWTGDANGYHLTWNIPGFAGQQLTIAGKPVHADFDLNTGNVPFFQRGFLAGLKCSAK